MDPSMLVQYDVQIWQDDDWVHLMGMLDDETAHRLVNNIEAVFKAVARVVPDTIDANDPEWY